MYMCLDDLLHFTPTYQWGYREAWCSPMRKILDWQDEGSCRMYDMLLHKYKNAVEATGSKGYIDNHVTFECTYEGQIWYVTFHDGGIYIGQNVRGEYSDIPVPPKIQYNKYIVSYDGEDGKYHVWFKPTTMRKSEFMRQFWSGGDKIVVKKDDKIIYKSGMTYDEVDFGE